MPTPPCAAAACKRRYVFSTTRTAHRHNGDEFSPMCARRKSAGIRRKLTFPESTSTLCFTCCSLAAIAATSAKSALKRMHTWLGPLSARACLDLAPLELTRRGSDLGSQRMLRRGQRLRKPSRGNLNNRTKCLADGPGTHGRTVRLLAPAGTSSAGILCSSLDT